MQEKKDVEMQAARPLTMMMMMMMNARLCETKMRKQN